MAAGLDDKQYVRLLPGADQDKQLQAVVQELKGLFSVNPGFTFYDDARAPNALATPQQLITGGSDGTVLFGTELLRRIRMQHAVKQYQHFTAHRAEPPKDVLGNISRDAQERDELVAVHELPAWVAAHEFGHVCQFKNGIAPRAGWQWELHADYLSGWWRHRVTPGIESTLTGQVWLLAGEQRLTVAVEKAYSLGDYRFFDPRHHGTPSQRAAMVIEGFRSAADGLSLNAAFERGAKLLRLT